MLRQYTLFEIMKHHRDGIVFVRGGIELGKSTAKRHGFMVRWKELRNGRYVIDSQEKV